MGPIRTPKINFHSIADLATSSSTPNNERYSPYNRYSARATSPSNQYNTPNSKPSHSINSLKVKMVPSPAESLNTSPLPQGERSRNSTHSPQSPAVSEDSGYGREVITPNRIPVPSDESDDSINQRLIELRSDKMRKYRKQRTVFEASQLKALEDTFNANAYPSSEEYESLALRVSIDEARLRIWFQNRRARHRRSAKHTTPTTSSPTLQSYPLPAQFNSPQVALSQLHNHMLMFGSTPPLVFGGY